MEPAVAVALVSFGVIATGAFALVIAGLPVTLSAAPDRHYLHRPWPELTTDGAEPADDDDDDVHRSPDDAPPARTTAPEAAR